MKKRLSLFLILAALTVKDTSHAQTNTQQSRWWQQLNQELNTLYQQGKYAEAIPVAVKLLEVIESIYGLDHPATAYSLNNLGTLYSDQGQFDKSEPLHQRALAIREKILGPDHPHVGLSLNNLATGYSALGQHARAEPLYQCALAILEKAMGA